MAEQKNLEDPRSILSTKLTYHNNNLEVALINMDFLEKISVSKECLESIQKFNTLFFSHMLRADANLPADLLVIPVQSIVYRDNKYQVDKEKIDALFKTENALEIIKKILAKVNGEKNSSNWKKMTAKDASNIDDIKYYNSNDAVTFDALKRVEQLNIFESMQNNDGIFTKPTPQQTSAKDSKNSTSTNPVVPSTKKQWKNSYDETNFPRQPEQPIGVELGKELQDKISATFRAKAERAIEEIRGELIGRVAFAPYNDRHYTLR